MYKVSKNRRIACKPPVTTDRKTVIKDGVAQISDLTELTGLEVVIPTHEEDYSPGDILFVTGESLKNNWAYRTYSLDGADFILVPEDAVVIHQIKGY